MGWERGSVERVGVLCGGEQPQCCRLHPRKSNTEIAPGLPSDIDTDKDQAKGNLAKRQERSSVGFCSSRHNKGGSRFLREACLVGARRMRVFCGAGVGCLG